MKPLTLVASVIVATLLIATANSRESIGVDQQADTEAKVKELQKQRIAVFKDIAAETTARFKNGLATPEEEVEARLQVLGAEAEIERGAARIKLYESAVETLKDLEKLAQAHFQAARATNTAVLKVKARRLEAEIALERAKAAK